MKEIFSHASRYMFENPDVFDSIDKEAVTKSLFEWLESYESRYVDEENIAYAGGLMSRAGYINLDRQIFRWFENNKTTERVIIVCSFLSWYWKESPVDYNCLNKILEIIDDIDANKSVENVDSKEYQLYRSVLDVLIQVANKDKVCQSSRSKIIDRLVYHYKYVKKGETKDATLTMLEHCFEKARDHDQWGQNH
jgi:predicted transcriptional regulator